MSFCDLAVSGVAHLQPYIPGKPIEELQRQYGVRNVVKLASNENPLGPPKAAAAAVAMAAKDMARYPDGNGYGLKLALAEKHQVAPEQITLGNGSNDVLELIARAFAGAGDEIIFSEHAFAVYAIVTQVIGATAVVTPAKDYGYDLDAIHKAISPRTKIIFIANPNNPTGTWLEPEKIKLFLEKVPEKVLVVLDEAYVEYLNMEENSVPWLQDFHNLIITRTFSKAYGLAGLRVGYSLSHPEVADLINRVRQPFNVSHLAQAAAVAALGDEAYLQQSRDVNEAGMKQLIAGFEKMGLQYIPSRANFITVNVHTNAFEVYDELLYEGVIVRPVANYGLPQHLRVSIGLAEENQRFLDALSTILGRG
ncbi:histidinol-phosphate aminotransferase 2 [Methylophaga marina]|uniref:Histidinol-phosphate aminotransferase n=1 Tax=Methylophaga marina TaxID=45495 RepID=A0ABP3CTF3_9GAMM|nr:histidinol-phosphate transaminase [Methylophaga marina]BDZ72906.1 histidinol-phosphate aminotransferase 2 [Methylophaga marina]